ncbi:hypothetical protein EAE96_004419 [Botrytis aclada]|nr:hypothetical protein EAE96_004419 [Botrytis aclada]
MVYPSGIQHPYQTRRRALEKGLISQLQSWMLPKYRVARIASLGHGSVPDFEIPRHTHGNTLFLSREVYGDGLDEDEDETKLVKRYTDRKIIIHRAYCYKREKRPVNEMNEVPLSFILADRLKPASSFPYTTGLLSFHMNLDRPSLSVWARNGMRLQLSIITIRLSSAGKDGRQREHRELGPIFRKPMFMYGQ